MCMISRREVLFMAALGTLLRGNAGAQQDTFHHVSRFLPDYLRDLAERLIRFARPHNIMTAPALFAKGSGGLPKLITLWAECRSVLPSTPELWGVFGYRVEKVVYESQPNFHISGTLYIPTVGRPPFPGVLYQMGHTTNGKGSGTYQLCCQTLAGLGYLVLGFDPMGRGTHLHVFQPSRCRNEEHTFPGRQMLLKGITSTRLQTWDAVRSLDYLASHSLVQTAGLDRTIGRRHEHDAVAAVDDRLRGGGGFLWHHRKCRCNFNPPGSTRRRRTKSGRFRAGWFDRWDLLYPIAPNPLLVMVSQRRLLRTYSPNYLTSGNEEFQKLQNVYRGLGHRRPHRVVWHAASPWVQFSISASRCTIGLRAG